LSVTRRSPARAALVLASLIVGLPASVSAQDKGDTTETAPPPDELVDWMMRRSWATGPARLFVAATLDIGYLYLRPRASFGYGKPFTSFFAIDVNPIISQSAYGAYGGLRLTLPFVTWRGGVRYSASFTRAYLDPKVGYDRLDFDVATNPKARVVTWETELEGGVPLGPGEITALASLSYVTNVPDDKFVFEETLRVIVDPPWVWRARGGYLVRFGSRNQHSVGLVVDAIGVPGRDKVTLRFGPVIRVVLSRRVEVRGSFVGTVSSPDELGLDGADFTELGLRYRWATE
jgi:hypothetical protein